MLNPDTNIPSERPTRFALLLLRAIVTVFAVFMCAFVLSGYEGVNFLFAIQSAALYFAFGGGFDSDYLLLVLATIVSVSICVLVMAACVRFSPAKQIRSTIFQCALFFFVYVLEMGVLFWLL